MNCAPSLSCLVHSDETTQEWLRVFGCYQPDLVTHVRFVFNNVSCNVFFDLPGLLGIG